MTAGNHHESGRKPNPVRGLAVADNGLKLDLDQRELPRGRQAQLSFTVVGADGEAVRDYEVEHDKRMHLIVVRRDMTGFQHLHPELDAEGRWSTQLKVVEAGSYRVFADFKRRGENHTLACDLAVDGRLDSRPLAPVKVIADAGGGYQVRLVGETSKARKDAEIGFAVTRNGKGAAVEDYLGAKGHLVALREGDLAYLHVHPTETGHGSESDEEGEHGSSTKGAEHGEAAVGAEPIRFVTAFPSDGLYALFLQFKHEGKVHTAAFTRKVAR